MTTAHDEDVDLAALTRWLQSQGLPSDVTAAERLGGGTQNTVLRLTISGRDHVLRHPLVAGSSDPAALHGSAVDLLEIGRDIAAGRWSPTG